MNFTSNLERNNHLKLDNPGLILARFLEEDKPNFSYKIQSDDIILLYGNFLSKLPNDCKYLFTENGIKLFLLINFFLSFSCFSMAANCWKYSTSVFIYVIKPNIVIDFIRNLIFFLYVLFQNWGFLSLTKLHSL